MPSPSLPVKGRVLHSSAGMQPLPSRVQAPPTPPPLVLRTAPPRQQLSTGRRRLLSEHREHSQRMHMTCAVSKQGFEMLKSTALIVLRGADRSQPAFPLPSTVGMSPGLLWVAWRGCDQGGFYSTGGLLTAERSEGLRTATVGFTNSNLGSALVTVPRCSLPRCARLQAWPAATATAARPSTSLLQRQRSGE